MHGAASWRELLGLVPDDGDRFDLQAVLPGEGACGGGGAHDHLVRHDASNLHQVVQL